MLLPVILLIAGFVVLLKASDYTVKNSIALSRQSGISEIIIGFVLVAIGTSVPEMSIAVISSLHGNGSLSFGNLIGANVALLTLVFGVMALIGFKIQKERLMEINQAIIFTLIIAVFLIYLMKVDIAFGIFSIVLFYAFLKNIYSEEKRLERKRHPKDRKKTAKILLYLLASISLVVVGAEMITKSATEISAVFGLGNTVIGATMLALGTTIPEFSVNIMALRKKDINLAIGDSIGSIVANITLVLGVASIISPIYIDASGRLALVTMLVASGIFLYFATHLKLKKEHGLILIASYIIFLYLMLSGAAV